MFMPQEIMPPSGGSQREVPQILLPLEFVASRCEHLEIVMPRS